jgi:hypothetical protein
MSCNCTNDVTTVAGELLNDLDNDSSLTVSYLSTWLQNNVGLLNNLIGTEIEIDENSEFSPCLTDDQKVLLKGLYICHYWSQQAKANLGASAYTPLEVRDGDRMGRFASKTDNAKIFTTMAKDCNTNLLLMVKSYKQGQVIPMSMSAHDTNMYLYPRIDD